jgi:hypothetical protein
MFLLKKGTSGNPKEGFSMESAFFMPSLKITDKRQKTATEKLLFLIPVKLLMPIDWKFLHDLQV